MKVSVYVDPTFTAEQQATILSAYKILQERAASAHVVDCAYRVSNSQLPTVGRDSHQGKNYFHSIAGKHIITESGTQVSPGTQIHLSRIYNDPGTAGRGFVGISNPHKEKTPVYSIALNSDYMGPQYHHGNNPDYWAGVIAHEMLHNQGFVHPSGYEGTFIDSYGKCVTSNGTGALYISQNTGLLPMPDSVD